MIRQVETIREALVAKDPANADTYRTNAAGYLKRLNALDKRIRAATALFPNRNLITFHDNFYFARDYGFGLSPRSKNFRDKSLRRG